jgi:hypothetical protein
MNLKCLILKDYLQINDDSHNATSIIDFPPSSGYIFNSMQMRMGFINRLHLAREELKHAESQLKGKRATKTQDDPHSANIVIIMKVLHAHYRENDYLAKGLLTDLI